PGTGRGMSPACRARPAAARARPSTPACAPGSTSAAPEPTAPAAGKAMRRTSETGAEGFPLVEILVVVAITGIVLAVAAVNLWPSDAEVARREAGLVALTLERARDAAWFGGRPTALTFNEGRTRQWRLAPDRTWTPDP